MLTELRGIDGQVYALARGPLTVTGVSVDAAGSSVEIGVPTSGRIPNGATVERVIPTPFEESDHVVLNMRSADFGAINAITNAINSRYGEGVATPLDSVSVAVRVPQNPASRKSGLSATFRIWMLILASPWRESWLIPAPGPR